MSAMSAEIMFELFEMGFRLTDKGELRRAAGSICNFSITTISEPWTVKHCDDTDIDIVRVTYHSEAEGGEWFSEHDVTIHTKVAVKDLLEWLKTSPRKRGW